MTSINNSATGMKFEQQSDGSWLLYLLKGISINQSFKMAQSGAAIDLTGYTFAFVAKKSQDGDSVLDLNSGNAGVLAPSPLTGIFTIVKADTSALIAKASGIFALTAVTGAGKTILLRSGKFKIVDEIP